MPIIRKHLTRLPFVALLACCGPNASASVDADDQELIDAASCPQLLTQHAKYAAAEKELADEIRQSGHSTTATNVLGLATMATLGIGFFHWNDNSDAEANLAELSAYRQAIAAAAKRKSCGL